MISVARLTLEKTVYRGFPCWRLSICNLLGLGLIEAIGRISGSAFADLEAKIISGYLALLQNTVQMRYAIYNGERHWRKS